MVDGTTHHTATTSLHIKLTRVASAVCERFNFYYYATNASIRHHRLLVFSSRAHYLVTHAVVPKTCYHELV